MSTRETVEKTVRQNPGITFTGLKRETGLANGTLQYHIRKSDSIVKKKGALLHTEECRDCDLKRFCGEKCLLSELRTEAKQDILRMLDEGYSQKDIAESLELDPSTVSYHVSRLKDIGAISGGRPVKELDL
ncbi:MAG: winged helix-turn-helix transcriptional regulator [Candidatus Nanohaloarchaea archaeon]